MLPILTHFAVGEENILLQYGVAGVCILGLAAAVVVLYKANQKLYEKISLLQDARRGDAQETIDKVTVPLNSISQTMNLIYDKLVVSKRNGG
jgi:hypothetical protein